MSNRKITEHGKLLIQIKKLIDTPEKWCQFRAYNKWGSMCIKGAMWKVTQDLAFQVKLEKLARSKVRRTLPGKCDIVKFNDTHTHKEVMDLLDEAIAMEVSGHE